MTSIVWTGNKARTIWVGVPAGWEWLWRPYMVERTGLHYRLITYFEGGGFVNECLRGMYPTLEMAKTAAEQWIGSEVQS